LSLLLPAFEYLTPTTLDEAARLLGDHSPSVALVAGGTGLFPNMKRRQTTPRTVVSLAGISDLNGIRKARDGRIIIGALTPLAELARSADVPPALAVAAAEVASPQIRNVATIGGNLCVDTRCNYMDMPDGWRRASGRCLKDGGDVCWVAPRSDRCWAINPSDTAPVAIALGGSARLMSVRGERVVPLDQMYRNDGIEYMTKAPDEILVELVLPPRARMRATYRKLRRRGSIDFPLISVAAAVRYDEDGACAEARLVIGAVSEAPLRATEAEEFLIGRRLTEDTIEEAARLASQPVRPQANTDLGSRYRKWMSPVLVSRALRDLV
jgi:4-hydroxybenzoyl-CoA reductase subunit beta